MKQGKGPGWHGEPRRHRDAALRGIYDGRQYDRRRTVMRNTESGGSEIEKTYLSRIEALHKAARERGHQTDAEAAEEERLNDEIIAHRLKIKGTAKDGSSTGGMYITEWKTVMVEHGNKTFEIPVDANGKVPEEVIIARYLNEDEGDRGGNKRNVVIDSNVTANVKIPRHPTPEQIVEWWAHPNESDALEIDTESADIFRTHGTVGKGSKDANRAIAILGGTAQQREEVRNGISTGFTVAEQKKMAGTTIHITDLKDASGEYHGKAFGGNYLVKLDRRYGINPETTDHELIHHLRVVDKDRDKPLTKARTYIGKDRDLEEASTVAETMARHKPYEFNKQMSYYAFMPNSPIKKGEDRGLFTQKGVVKAPDGAIKADDNPQLIKSGRKGKRAINSTEKNFKDSNISHLSITPGKKEAIDQYYVIVNKDGSKEQVQKYSPLGERSPPKVTGQQKLFEYRDGKKYQLK